MNSARITAPVAAAILALVLTACSDDASTDAHDAEHTASNGDVFNDADVDFASGMIPHHAQALVMVDLTHGRTISPELTTLTEDIRAAQGPEIEQMVDWLTAWDQPVPETMRDHANAHDTGEHQDSDHESMPGMMSEDDLARLEDAQGDEFESLWLEMMIEHHEGAIEMAQDEQEHGTYPPAVELAETIETAQQAEIDHMEDLLER